MRPGPAPPGTISGSNHLQGKKKVECRHCHQLFLRLHRHTPYCKRLKDTDDVELFTGPIKRRRLDGTYSEDESDDFASSDSGPLVGQSTWEDTCADDLPVCPHHALFT